MKKIKKLLLIIAALGGYQTVNAEIDMAKCGIPDNSVMPKIVQHESKFNQFAIGINVGDGSSRSLYAPDKQTAVEWSKELLGRGYASIDMGYAQINSKNLSKLGVSIDNIFDECTNLQAGRSILQNNLAATGGNLIRALAMYNTGKPDSPRGLQYAAAVLGGKPPNKEPIGFKTALNSNPMTADSLIDWDSTE